MFANNEVVDAMVKRRQEMEKSAQAPAGVGGPVEKRAGGALPLHVAQHGLMRPDQLPEALKQLTTQLEQDAKVHVVSPSRTELGVRLLQYGLQIPAVAATVAVGLAKAGLLGAATANVIERPAPILLAAIGAFLASFYLKHKGDQLERSRQ